MTRGGPARATYVLGLQLVEFVTEYHNLGYSAAIAVIMLGLIIAFVSVLLYYLTRE